MLQMIIKDNILTATGIVGFYPANSIGDDVAIYSTESRADTIAMFYGLRQQAEKVQVKQLII
jgi:5-methyltetrahydrofolate--homocysteine methyltransferase